MTTPGTSATGAGPSNPLDNVTTIADLSTILGLVDEDLNGECFVAGAEGEIEELIDANLVPFPHGVPSALEANRKIVFTDDQTTLFLVANAYLPLTAGTERQAADRIKIAYIRFLAARNGLISPDFNRNAHNVKYNDAYRMTEDNTITLIGAVLNDKPFMKLVNETLTAQFRTTARKAFTNYVCCVAYMFRVRGHHYKADFHARYETLWNRCLQKPADLVLPWSLLATDALHAIMPDVLDAYWLECAKDSRCAGTLIKRIDSAPAGVAGVFALKRGLDDIMMIFPGAVSNIPGAYKEFVALLDRIKASRWGGSINARYYGAARIRYDESSFGALASVIMGVYDQLAPDSKLRESPALQRLAQIAPATGGAIGLAARNATADPRINLLDIAGAPRVIESGE